MEKKWKSPQAIIVIIIITLIFAYIAIDAFFTKPQIKKDLTEVKGQYVELSGFLDTKIPEIDSTFSNHAKQIKQSKDQMITLEKTFKKIANGE